MSKGIVLSENSAAHLKEVVRDFNRGPSLLEGYGEGIFVSSGMQTCRVTSTTLDSNNNYPAVVTQWSQPTSAWVDFVAVKLKPANGESLTSGTRYDAYLAGENTTGELVYLTHVQGGGGVAVDPSDMVDSNFPLITQTFEVYRGGLDPSLYPPSATGSCLYQAFGMDNRTLNGGTHIALLPPTTDVRDDYPGGSYSYGPNADRVYIPAAGWNGTISTGTQWRVILARRCNITGIGDKKHLLLARVNVAWPCNVL